MVKYFTIFSLTFMIIVGCSPKQTTPKNFVDKLQKHELFDEGEDDRDCYENFFAEIFNEGQENDFTDRFTSLNELDKAFDKGIKIIEKGKTRNLGGVDQENCGMMGSAWTKDCPYTDKEVQEARVVLMVTMGPGFACMMSSLPDLSFD